MERVALRAPRRHAGFLMPRSGNGSTNRRADVRARVMLISTRTGIARSMATRTPLDIALRARS